MLFLLGPNLNKGRKLKGNSSVIQCSMMKDHGLKLMTKILEYSNSDSCPQKYKVNFNIKNSLGNTALHYACRTGNVELVKFLIEKCKVNPNVLNIYGNRPIKFCKKYPELFSYMS